MVAVCRLGKRLRLRSEERRVGKEWRSLCDWSSDVCSSDLRRSFLRSRCCGSEWCMTSGGIAVTMDLLKHKFPAQGPCWTGFSTGRDQTDSLNAWNGGRLSIGEKTSP